MAAQTNKQFVEFLKTFSSFFVAIFQGLINFIKWIPSAISKKLKISISFKIAFSYIKIMFDTFFLIFAILLILLTSYKMNLQLINDNKVITPILNEATTINSLSNELSKNGYSSKYYNNALIKDNSELNFEYLKKYIPFRLSNNTFYFLSHNTLNFEGIPYTIFIYHDITVIVHQTSEIGAFLLISGIILIIFTFFIGLFSNRKEFLPIHDMTETINNISAQNLSARINVSGSQNELKELAKAFNNTMNKIEDSYNKQKQFTSDASHELRTPIAVIQGYANMLNRWGKEDSKILQESIDAIVNESENMKNLVEKLLFISRNDNNTLKLQVESFNLNNLLSEIVKDTQLIDNNHIIEYNSNTNLIISADKTLIKQAIRIIIDNAIKYTPNSGKITISTNIDDNFCVVSISDTGLGISKDDLDHIFDRFYRSDKSRTKESGGHGLGLHIAKIIILRHKGKIKVRSKVNEGTEFKVYLPIDKK